MEEINENVKKRSKEICGSERKGINGKGVKRKEGKRNNKNFNDGE